MYKCNNCGLFTKGKTHAVDAVVCEHCGSDDIDPAAECSVCGELIDSSKDVCEHCDEVICSVLEEACALMENRLDVDHSQAISLLDEYCEMNK